MFCPGCGKELTADAVFCPACGTKNPSSSAPTAAPQTSAPTAAPVSTPTAAPVVAPVVKVGGSGKGLFIGIILLAVAAFVGYLFFFTNTFKSDEEVIRARLESFQSDYNDGDMEALTENFDNKTRSTIESTIGLTESLFGGLTGYGVNYSDLFGLGVALNDGDMLVFGDIESIDINGENATVVVELTMNANMMGQSHSTSETVQIDLVKESAGFLNEDWFIVNMR